MEKASWQFYNRYTEREEAEAIYGEKWLRWAYQHPVGRMATWSIAKRAWFSRWYGQRMRRPETARLIQPFIEQYQLDPKTFADPVESFGCFNDFFVRRLRPEARPVDSDPEAVVFPADGRHLLLPELLPQTGLWAKGESFKLSALFGSDELAENFEGGAAVVSRLAPVDYHRFHFPVGGEAGESSLLPGPLYSVHPLALGRATRYLVANKRMVTLVQPEGRDPVALVEIGATNVGTICQTYSPGMVQMGTEKGYFAFGGSCVVTVFAPGSVAFAGDLVTQSARGRELYAHMGDRMGRYTL